jgi:hypothetical protein
MRPRHRGAAVDAELKPRALELNVAGAGGAGRSIARWLCEFAGFRPNGWTAATWTRTEADGATSSGRPSALRYGPAGTAIQARKRTTSAKITKPPMISHSG